MPHSSQVSRGFLGVFASLHLAIEEFTCRGILRPRGKVRFEEDEGLYSPLEGEAQTRIYINSIQLICTLCSLIAS